jgi:hypothetical protein
MDVPGIAVRRVVIVFLILTILLAVAYMVMTAGNA